MPIDGKGTVKNVPRTGLSVDQTVLWKWNEGNVNVTPGYLGIDDDELIKMSLISSI